MCIKYCELGHGTFEATAACVWRKGLSRTDIIINNLFSDWLTDRTPTTGALNIRQPVCRRRQFVSVGRKARYRKFCFAWCFNIHRTVLGLLCNRYIHRPVMCSFEELLTHSKANSIAVNSISTQLSVRPTLSVTVALCSEFSFVTQNAIEVFVWLIVDRAVRFIFERRQSGLCGRRGLYGASLAQPSIDWR